VTVIDISRYQGVVDFGAVKSAGVGVVIAKMGGGDAGPYVDANWSTNRDGIRAAGLKLGSYYFNGPGQSPIAAADYQFQNIGYQPGDLVVIDVEGGAIAWSVSQVIEWVNQMLTHGVPASSIGVYMSASVVNNYNWGPVAALGTFLWVASYGANTGQPGTPPTVIHWPGWAFWQYTSNGSIAGVPGRVDMSQIAPEWAGGNVTPLINIDPQEEDMKIYEDGGPTAPAVNTGKFYAGAPGVWYPIDNAAFGGDANVRGILTSAFNAPILMFSSDMAATSAVYKATGAAASGVPTDLAPVMAAISGAVTSIETHGSAVDLSPVLTQLANLTATLTKGYTFNVKPSA